MHRPVTIPIFFSNGTTLALADLDVKYPLSACDIRPVRLYNICGFTAWYDEEHDDRSGKTFQITYTELYVGQREIYSPLTPDEVRRLIERRPWWRQLLDWLIGWRRVRTIHT